MQPNILFLMSDQHTASLMGGAGAAFVRTPNMDRLAASGVRFANAYCAHPHCVPSRASLMTGLQTYKMPCYDNGSTFRSDLPTWAHMLRHAGYHTALNGKMHFVGEDYYHGFHEHINEPRCQIGGFRWGEEKPDPTTGKKYWADLHFEGDPVFEKRWRDETDRVRDTVAFLCAGRRDKPWIGAILSALEKSGQADNTIIFYTSDHGEMWGERGVWGKQIFYEESALVPLIVSAPACGIRKGVTVDTPVSLLDIYPTLRDLAGAGQWQVPLDGRSLTPALTNDLTLPDVPVFCEYDGPDTKGPERMVRFRNWKLNYYHQQGMELFDLAADPRELRNLADDPAHRPTRDRLWAMLTDGWDPDTIDRLVREDQNRRTWVTQCYPGEVKAL